MQNSNLKIIVAHPGRQHSFRVASALKEQGLLFKYITTVYDRDDSLLMKFTKFFLSKENKKRASNRKCPKLVDDDVIQFNQYLSLLLLLVIRLDRKKLIVNRFNDYISKLFQKELAKYAIEHNVDAVICYDANCQYCFQILKDKAPQIIRIMDNAAPNRNYLYKVYSDNMSKCDNFKIAFNNYKYLIHKTVAKRFGDEVKLADYHLVASSFSKGALEYEGIESTRIFVVPYGVDEDKFVPATRNYNEGILNILYVGEVNQRKGILQLLEAAKAIHQPNIKFNIVGDGVESYPDLFKPYEQYVTFHGPAYFEKLLKHLEANHIFLFPSMGDGFGLVLLEAMAAGLPIIASKNSAGPDLVNEGKNGFLIEPGNTDNLVKCIMWCYNNMDKLPEMSSNARESARQFTWDNYKGGIVDAVRYMVGQPK